MGLQDAVDDFWMLRQGCEEWRVIGMLTEEAGEIQGAFNKMMDGNKRKPKTREDVIEELVQLTGCCFIAARFYGIEVEDMTALATGFLREKIAQIQADGWSPDDQMGYGQENNPDPR